ncbi:MAG TPA: MmcB family DNA repair protein [Alphaproteobacteria bacterium]|nr:MmcB family DNA repair protein [Alphaproteobacteria bacterium]
MDSALAELPPIVDLRQSPTALRIQRGVMRFLRGTYDFCCFTEVPLANGRRADVLALGPRGEIWIVEIKSSLIDFQVDRKWPDYKDYCDRFFFAKPPELDPDIFPESEGLIVADAHDAAVLRMAGDVPLPAARRKALILKLARLGADRVHTLMDPGTKIEPGELR